MLADSAGTAWERWKESESRPQIIVIDKGLGIRFRCTGGMGHEEGLLLAEELLAE